MFLKKQACSDVRIQKASDPYPIHDQAKESSLQKIKSSEDFSPEHDEGSNLLLDACPLWSGSSLRSSHQARRLIMHTLLQRLDEIASPWEWSISGTGRTQHTCWMLRPVLDLAPLAPANLPIKIVEFLRYMHYYHVMNICSELDRSRNFAECGLTWCFTFGKFAKPSGRIYVWAIVTWRDSRIIRSPARINPRKRQWEELRIESSHQSSRTADRSLTSRYL